MVQGCLMMWLECPLPIFAGLGVNSETLAGYRISGSPLSFHCSVKVSLFF